MKFRVPVPLQFLCTFPLITSYDTKLPFKKQDKGVKKGGKVYLLYTHISFLMCYRKNTYFYAIVLPRTGMT